LQKGKGEGGRIKSISQLSSKIERKERGRSLAIDCLIDQSQTGKGKGGRMSQLANCTLKFKKGERGGRLLAINCIIDWS